jgi:hypothetical protein
MSKQQAAMNKQQAVHMIRSGRVREWNAYREAHPDWVPDLSHEDFTETEFVTQETLEKVRKLELHHKAANDKALSPIKRYCFNFRGANLIGTKLPENIDHYYISVNYYSNRTSRAAGDGRKTFMVDLKGSEYDLSTQLPVWLDPVENGMLFRPQVTALTPEQYVPSTVFISYTWADDEVVLAIENFLTLKGLRTTIDRRDFFAGDRIMPQILSAMQASDVILIFYSGQAKDKAWPEFERETAADLQMEARKAGRKPPRVIYVVMDDTPLPSPVQSNRLAVMAKGKTVKAVAEELYLQILQISRGTPPIPPGVWDRVI